LLGDRPTTIILDCVAFYLGIDGGGSKTSCLVGDETSVLGEGTGGGSNVVRLGETSAAKSLFSAIVQACTAAGISPSQLVRTCMGAAGGSRAQIAEVLGRILSEIAGGDVSIVGDMEIALEAAFPRGPGVVVIAGTGSIAYGRNEKQETARVGGWGFAISDEGSGHWIGRAAIGAALRDFDEGKDSKLLQDTIGAWQLQSREQLVISANATPAPDFSSLFPVAVAAAEHGDEVAGEVLRRAGRELATLAGIAIRRLFDGADSVPVAMTGGVFVHSALVRETFSKELSAQWARTTVRREVVVPVHGALELARRNTR
jgi:glucosamine kinase